MVGKSAVGKKRRAEEEEEAAAMPAEEEDSGSDGGEHSDGDDAGGLSGFASNGAGEAAEDKTTAWDALWADPTHDEMQGLRETELLFKSSLMRLQVGSARTFLLLLHVLIQRGARKRRLPGLN